MIASFLTSLPAAVAPGMPGVSGDDPVTAVVHSAHILVAALVVAGVAWFVTGLVILAIERGWFGDAEHPIGTVVALVADPPESGRMYPVVRFFNEAGHRIDVRTSRRAHGIVPGDIVDLVHESDGTTRVRPPWFRFGTPQVTLVFGVALIAGGVLLLRVLPAFSHYATGK